jgi:hypothetical protein
MKSCTWLSGKASLPISLVTSLSLPHATISEDIFQSLVSYHSLLLLKRTTAGGSILSTFYFIFACPHTGSFTLLPVARSCFLAYSASTSLFLLKPLSRPIHRSSSRLRLLFQTYLFEELAFERALNAEILETALLNFVAKPFVDGPTPAPHGGRGWYNIMRHILS